ncbi:hypothetical protein CJ030_MR3G001298 [Morella rubra]|uniref:Uncharacterized protein n=1 Tax=Morella rubra TaxID=262757 RepID=A0A6A1W1V6_9ROSI|nr:hypothetical protein CJ030_MR3G001298 [Morella rubra]
MAATTNSVQVDSGADGSGVDRVPESVMVEEGLVFNAVGISESVTMPGVQSVEGCRGECSSEMTKEHRISEYGSGRFHSPPLAPQVSTSLANAFQAHVEFYMGQEKTIRREFDAWGFTLPPDELNKSLDVAPAEVQFAWPFSNPPVAADTGPILGTPLAT